MPTISGLYEMCAAGGGESKLYRLRFPFNPHEVVRCCLESLVLDHLTFPFVNHTFMIHPIFSIPKFVVSSNRFNREQPSVCEDKLSLRNTGKFSLLPFLAQMAVFSMFYHVAVEHTGCGSTVNVPALGEHLLPPLLSGEPGNDPGLDCGEVGHDELPTVLRHKGGADELGQGVRHILIEHLHGGEVAGAHYRAGLFQIGNVVFS